jgi:hypothetical protein
MTTKEQLLDALDNNREKLLVAIEPLPDEALHEKQAVGEWSVSDALINITAWEAELVTGLMRIRQNQRPDRLLEALKDPAEYDKRRFAENQDRDLDQVFLDCLFQSSAPFSRLKSQNVATVSNFLPMPSPNTIL